MRYAVTVISVAYDLSWVSRSASQAKVSTVTAAQPSTFRACKRRYWAGDPLKTTTRQASPITRTPSISGCAFLAGETVLAARRFTERSIDPHGGDQRSVERRL